MKTKKINYENGITYFLTNSKESYTQLAKNVESALRFMGIPMDIIAKRVKGWAHGTLPIGPELDAITIVKYGNKSKWQDLYFPDNEYTLKFIEFIVNKEINKVLYSSMIDSFVKERNLETSYNGLADKDASLQTLASILIFNVYSELKKKDLLSPKVKNSTFDFKNYKEEIIPFLTDCLGKIPQNCIFIENTKRKLKRVLIKDGTNRANIRGEALRQVISIV